MTLPEPDIEYLARRSVPHEIAADGAMTCLVLQGWALPQGLSQTSADLLVRLQPGYPDLAPDMWWFSPELFLEDGRRIQATEVMENHLGRTWQRWSRHLEPGQWRSGIDSLESYVTLIDRELERCVMEPVS
ncbi:E2/UBC family protein [Nocardia alni]|uniref:E2/UBC family protein n=1 Tax=Nocardia alni TaxID=2815723 RepID=UPI001C231CDC|nr:E2/UBC family protein [Nocardia alni]